MKRNKRSFKILVALCLLVINNSFAQQVPSREVRDKLQKVYNTIKNPEISFDRFLEINAHVYSGQTITTAATSALQDTYCNKVRAYCGNSDFESGLDQNQYTGAYGLWSADLYPNPFGLTYGFISGALTDGSSHQTVVDKSSGVDPVAGIPLVPANGGNKSLRLGNAVNGLGTEIIAKTIKVDPNENILGFYYAVVLQDPGHDHDDQPAFSVRAYDCATGLELPNVCDLGNGSNIAVADANNPFFQNKIYQSEKLVYRDWSKVQIDLSKYVGKTVIIVFTTKDCNLSGHFGYAYLDNLFSSNCPAPTENPTDSSYSGNIALSIAHTDTCGAGSICVKYVLPSLIPANGGAKTLGNVTISLGVFQNGNPVKTVTSSAISTYSPDSSYCFGVVPSNLGLDATLGGFDYTITGRFSINNAPLSPIIIGNPGTGVKSGTNNDYVMVCGTPPPPPPPPLTGLCPADINVQGDPLTCKAKVSWTIPSTAFPGSITIKSGTNLASASLIYKGTFNGHGYYESDDQYTWTDARDAAIAVGAHLITINSAAENNFVAANIMEHSNYAWIGLYNTGTVGSFAWVTGEPLNFTYWIPGEPDNLYNDNSNPTIYEPYVHINGFDSLSRWNDLGSTATSKFLAEFDSAVFTYKQVSGPTSGDSLKSGIYNVCYEKTNLITGIPENCCFKVIVTCSSMSSGCPGDTTLTADPVTCMARLTWTLPSALYPDSIPVTPGVFVGGGMLKYKGIFNGHGYYESTDRYAWLDARNAVAAVGGHLITITSAAENSFVGSNIMEKNNYAWIGLSNSGTFGNFNWVTGEPVSFTNWIPGEPDNLYNLPNNPNIYEPYVHINGFDSLSRWNDIGAANYLNFIGEFDSSVIRYKQISGPAYGDSVKAGIYTICYEKTNPFTLVKDTCCFNITVACNATNTNSITSTQNVRTNESDGLNFNVIAYPNPSNTSFKVRINSSNNKDKISMKVVDITGRMIEMNSNIAAGNTLNFGSKYTPGIYFTTVTQGSKSVVIKLVKQ